MRRSEGSFPTAGPVVYLTEVEAQAQRLFKSAPGPERRWFHATSVDAGIAAIHNGLIPSCWRGGDCCVVCGHDSLDDVHSHQGPWVLEIYSAALPGQLKAWWVPASAICGVWIEGNFQCADQIRATTTAPPLTPTSKCHCQLGSLVEREIGCWQKSTR